jgi:hypothetical protein
MGKGETERVLLKRSSPKKSLPLDVSLSLTLLFFSSARALSFALLAVVLVSATLIGHWQTMSAESLTKRALYRMSERRARCSQEEKPIPLLLFPPIPRDFRVYYAWRINSFSPRYRWDLIGGYYLSWNWVKTRGLIPGTHAYTRATEDGLSHLHSRTCTSG